MRRLVYLAAAERDLLSILESGHRRPLLVHRHRLDTLVGKHLVPREQILHASLRSHVDLPMQKIVTDTGRGPFPLIQCMHQRQRPEYAVTPAKTPLRVVSSVSGLTTTQFQRSSSIPSPGFTTFRSTCCPIAAITRSQGIV